MSEHVEIIADLKDLISGKFADINKQIDAMDSKLGKLGGGSIGGGGIMGQVFGANLLTGAISKMSSAVIDFGKDSFQAYGKSEQFLVSLTTMFRGNREEAKALDSQLKNFAIETPFELNEIRDATKMMIAYGSQSGSVVDEMRMLGDISSGVGSSLSEVAYLYGTLRTQGRAFSKDIYQFTGRGIPIIKELAKQFNVADSAVMKLVEDGKVGFKEVEKAMQSMTAEGGQFHNMMSEQAKTLLGQTSNLADAWDQLKTAIGQSQSGILKATVSWATDMVNQIKRIVDRDNYRENATKNLGIGGIQTGMFDDYTDERDVKYWDPVKKEYTTSKTRRSRNEYIGRGLYKETDPYGKNYDATTSSRYTDYYNTPISAKGQFEKFSNDIFDKISKAKPNEAQNLKNELSQIYFSLKKERDQNLVSPMMFNSKASVLNDAIKTTNELIRSFSEKTKPSDKQPGKLEEVAKKNKAVQVIVNIENLVRELTNINNEASQLNKLTTDGTLKALTVAVNDIYAAGQV